MKCLVISKEEFLSQTSIWSGNTFQVINKAISEKKDIYLYGNYSEESQLIEDILAQYQVKIAGKVYKNEIKNKNILDIYELAYKNIDKLAVIIAEYDEKQSESVCDILDKIGLKILVLGGSTSTDRYYRVKYNTLFYNAKILIFN